MSTIFMVNGKEQEALQMLVNGIDFSGDFIGNTAHEMDTDEEGRYIASQEDYDWWKNVINQHQKMEMVIAHYKSRFDADEVDRVVQDWIDTDLDNQPNQVLLGLEQAFGSVN